jgi:hypothetical protein
MKIFSFILEYIFNLSENKKQIYRSNYKRTAQGDLRSRHGIILEQTIIKINDEFSIRSRNVNSCHSKYAARFLTVGGKT